MPLMDSHAGPQYFCRTNRVHVQVSFGCVSYTVVLPKCVSWNTHTNAEALLEVPF